MKEKLYAVAVLARYLLLQPRLFRKLLSASYKGYLLKAGWINSVIRKLPLDRQGKPLPWLTYPSIHFLDERLTPEMKVFEFGSGHSTLYFAERVRMVTTVEHNPQWCAYLKERILGNCQLVFEPLEYDGAYCRAAKATGEKYDVVLIDGRDRVNCARNAVPALTDSGVIIFDDFERERYQEAGTFLAEAGFRQLNFWGMKPGLMEGANTAIFYRSSNVFGI